MGRHEHHEHHHDHDTEHSCACEHHSRAGHGGHAHEDGEEGSRHGHGHHAHDGHGEKKALLAAFALTAGFMLVEIAGGLWTRSISLVSDGAHMLTDSAALGLGFFAVVMAQKRGSATKTFGYQRVEVLAALANGLALWLISGFIIREAFERFFQPREVMQGPMLVIAVIGLIINIICAKILHGGHKHNINMRGAFLHVLGDLLGSVGVIAAGLVIAFTGWTYADPLASLFIVGLILFNSFNLVRDAVHILMEGAPAHIKREEVISALAGINGVCDVHELHIWTLTTGVESLSAHILIKKGADNDAILQQAHKTMAEKFGIRHSTIQVESARLAGVCENDRCCP